MLCNECRVVYYKYNTMFSCIDYDAPCHHRSTQLLHISQSTDFILSAESPCSTVPKHFRN